MTSMTADDYKPAQSYGAVTVDTRHGVLTAMRVEDAVSGVPRALHSGPAPTATDLLAKHLYPAKAQMAGAHYSSQPLLTIGPDGKGVMRSGHQDESVADFKGVMVDEGPAPRVTWNVGQVVSAPSVVDHSP